MRRSSLSVLVFMALAGCASLPPGANTASRGTTAVIEPATEGGGEVAFIRTGSDGHSLPVAAETRWPQGWMLDAHGAPVPIVDDVGRTLRSARDAFHAEDLDTAVRELDAAADALAAAPGPTASRLDAVAALRALARRVGSDELTTMHLFEAVITRVYAERVSLGWVPLTTPEFTHVVERSDAVRAAMRTPSGDAPLVRAQLLALYRVERTRDTAPDAALLDALNTANEALRTADAAARDAALARVDLALAEHELQRAEDELNAAEPIALGATLIALSRHVANLDAVAPDGSSDLAARLDAAGHAALAGQPARATSATLAQTARHLRDVEVSQADAG